MPRPRCYAYFIQSARDFYVLAVVIGLVQGGVQSLSRSYFGRLVPEGKSSEFFGFYNMMGKFAAVLGPLLTGVVARVTGDSRLSILSILVLFVAGAALLAVAGRAEQSRRSHRKRSGRPLGLARSIDRCSLPGRWIDAVDTRATAVVRRRWHLEIDAAAR